MVKRVCGAIYAHKSNFTELLLVIPTEAWQQFKNCLTATVNSGLSFEIVKFNKFNNTFSFIESPDWNTAKEPEVGSSYCYSTEGVCSVYKGRGQIYHSKELFVAKNYKGFDINVAAERTKLWNQIADINTHKSKIGYKNYWLQLLQANGLEV